MTLWQHMGEQKLPLRRMGGGGQEWLERKDSLLWAILHWTIYTCECITYSKNEAHNLKTKSLQWLLVREMSNKWPLLKNRGGKARVNSKWPLWEENANEEPVVFNPHSYNYKPENKIKNNFLEHKEEPQVLVVGCGGESQLSSPAGVRGRPWPWGQVCRNTSKRRPAQLYFCASYFKLQNCLLIIYKKQRVQKQFALTHYLCKIIEDIRLNA